MNLKNKLKDTIKSIGKKPAISNLIGFIAYIYTLLIGKTSSFKVTGFKEFDELIKKHNGAIFVTWHGRALFLPYFWSNSSPMKALVSPHQDGRIIAKLLRSYNILSIDGSTDRNPKKAALEIVRELNKGTSVALISDGPRGPRMRLNKSVIYFAKKTGKPIMGFTYSAARSKVMKKSWDAMLIPPLFTSGYVFSTAPLFVPASATEDEMEILRQQLEDELNLITKKADELCGLDEITIGDDEKKRRINK
ncbi:MAG: lysophospholipid acyltransferase family protein [Alphaproteobacteria bacterium]|nr:lysophospholipid acyltransferase family protein [Alphaproteobacteria bacterium]